MKTIDILRNLFPFIQEARLLKQQETELHKEAVYTYAVSLSYDTIALKIIRLNMHAEQKEIHLHVSFTINQKKISVKEIYHTDQTAVQGLTAALRMDARLHEGYFHESSAPFHWPPEEAKHLLKLADSIAEKALHQSSGDDYRPGYFSTIEISETQITLSQVNHMNSRSLNHKDNYSLRDLTFVIPLDDNPVLNKGMHDSYLIGNMLVQFSDRSSANNRTAGEAIQKKIEELVNSSQ